MACWEFKLSDYAQTIDLTKDPGTDGLVRGVPSAIEVMVDSGLLGTLAFFCWGDDEGKPPRTFTELTDGKQYEGGGIVKIVIAQSDVRGVRVRWENVR
jgi:hypothetical protein